MSDTEKLLEKFEARIILTIQTTESKIMNNINETFKKFDERLVALETKSKMLPFGSLKSIENLKKASTN